MEPGFFLLNILFSIAVLLKIVERVFPKEYQDKDKREPVQLAWVALAVAVVSAGIKYVIPLFRRRTYTSGAYALGEIYRRNVLGESITTRDDRVVGDEAVYLARNIFTAGFGIFIGSNTDMDLIRDNNWTAYRDKMKRENPKYFPYLTKEQFDRAAALKQTFFPYQKSPPPAVWDLANFGRIPLLGKIPDVENPGEWMTVELPGGLFIAEGEIIDPTKAQAQLIQAIQSGKELPADWRSMLNTTAPNEVTAQQPGTVTPGGQTNWLLYGAIAAGAFFLLRKKRA